MYIQSGEQWCFDEIAKAIERIRTYLLNKMEHLERERSWRENMDMKEKIVRMEERLNLEESLITGEIAFKVESELVQRIMADYHPARIPYLTINKLEQMIF